MPNYGLVVTPTYNPMSYEQYIQPFKDYAQVYNATVDQIDALEMEANQWERLADSDIDAPQYAQYKSYADDLRKYANEIATQGLSSRTRAGLSRMRQRYAKEIKPIEEAFNYRQKMAEEQRKLNPIGDLQYTVDFSNIGLGEIMRNPSLGYSARSLSEIEKSAFEQAQAFSTRSITSRHATELGNQYFQILQGQGQAAASEFLKGVQEGRNNEFTAEDLQHLNDLYNQVRDTYGLSSPSSPFSSSQNSLADERVLSGIMKGLALKDQYLTNYYAKPSGSGSGSSSSSEKGYYLDPEGRFWYEPSGDKSFGRVLRVIEKDKQGNIVKGIPVQNEDKTVALMDPTKDTFSTEGDGHVIVNGKVRQSQSKEPVPVLPSPGKVVVKNIGEVKDKESNKVGAKTFVSEKDLNEVKGKVTDPLVYEQLSKEEQETLPEAIRKNPNKYVFYRHTEDASGYGWGKGGDNEVIYWEPVKTNTVSQSTLEAALQDAQQSSNFNENAILYNKIADIVIP